MNFLTWFSWNIKWYILLWKIECHTELTFVLVHAWMFYARSIFNFPSHNKLLMQFQNVKLWLIYSSHPSNCWKLFKCQSLTLPKMQKNKFSYLSLCISKLHSQCPITKMDWLKVLRQSKSINCLSQRKKCNLGSKTKKLALTDIDYFTFNFEFSTIKIIIS